jgi:protein-tyrosine phosphatase
VIDLHCHVLPGIDDGPRTIEESVAVARTAYANGIRTIVATPHASTRYPNRPAAIRELVAEVNGRLQAESIGIDIRTGAEIAMTHTPEIDAAELAQMTLGGGGWLLLEPPFSPVVAGLDRLVEEVQDEGYQVVLAHPERCPAFHRDIGLLETFVDNRALTSITAGSLVGRFGKEVKRFAFKLLDRGLVHNVASDAHDPLLRPPGIRAELDRAGLGAMSDWLCQDVPAAILSGADIPERPRSAIPAGKGSRRLIWRR